MKKKTNLESGFLFLYDWMPVLERLPAKEVKLLLLALIARQREGVPLPTFRNPLTDSFARIIEPVIRRRLEGAAAARRGTEATETPTGEAAESPSEEAVEVPTGAPSGVPPALAPPPRGEEGEMTKEEQNDSLGEWSDPLGEPPPTALRALSEQEKEALRLKGLPTDYIADRAHRALCFEARTGRPAMALLEKWWHADRKPLLPKASAALAEKEPPSGSFDIDDFFAAALRKSYGDRVPLPPEVEGGLGLSETR